MHMSFWFDYKIDNFFFYGLNITNISYLVLLCVIVAGFTITFEYVKLLQTRQRQKEIIIRAKQIKTICPVKEDSKLLPQNNTMMRSLEESLSLKNRVKLYACDASLWFFLHNLGYLIMLMVMLYNFWIFLSVVTGGGIGYFIFGQRLLKVHAENCQVIKDAYCMANCTNPDYQNGESTPVMAASTSTVACHGEIKVSIHDESSNADKNCLKECCDSSENEN